MADVNDQVTAPSSAVPTGTSGDGGVPSGTPAPGASDAIDNISVQDLLAKLQQAETDRRNMQAVKDRELAEARKRQDAITAELERIKTQGMTDAEKIAYERDSLAKQLEELKAQAQQREMMQQYSQAYSQLGVDVSKLDTSSPEALATSGWAAIAERIKSLETGTASPAASTRQPPTNNSRVVTGQGGVPKTKPTLQEMVAASGAKDLDEFFSKYAERNPDAINQWLQQE